MLYSMTTAHRATVYRSLGRNYSFFDKINESINYYYKKNDNIKRKIKFKNKPKKKILKQPKLMIKLIIKFSK
uniref:Uncharacterized protein n=1 Tax=Lotharella vacuolata TaxID=74820 RepID=A0A0H5BQX3_9EUKA|nr:hypothetical protein [Lotharella vacuolata]